MDIENRCGFCGFKVKKKGMGGHWKGCVEAAKYRLEVIKEAEKDVETRDLKMKKKWP